VVKVILDFCNWDLSTLTNSVYPASNPIMSALANKEQKAGEEIIQLLRTAHFSMKLERGFLQWAAATHIEMLK